jgi:hypothetical protein
MSSHKVEEGSIPICLQTSLRTIRTSDQIVSGSMDRPALKSA